MSEWIETKVAEIKAVLEVITDLKNIYKRDRWTVDPQQFRNLFTEPISGKNRRVHTWMIGREGFRETKDYQVRFIRTHSIIIRGFFAFNEEKDSWTAFQSLIDKISAGLRNNQTIWNACSEGVEEAVQARLIGYEFFGEVFCHYCELVLEVEEHNIKTY